MEKENLSGLLDIDRLPLAIKKFMKSEYLIFYEESKQNEAEVEFLKKGLKRYDYFTPITAGNFEQGDDDNLGDFDYEDIENDEEFYEDMYDDENDEEEYYDRIYEQINEDIQKEISEDIMNGRYKKNSAKVRSSAKNQSSEEYDIDDEYIDNDEDYITEEEYEEEEEEEIKL